MRLPSASSSDIHLCLGTIPHLPPNRITKVNDSRNPISPLRIVAILSLEGHISQVRARRRGRGRCIR